MSHKHQMLADLDKLIKTAAAAKAGDLKKIAGPGDPLDKDNGTQAAQTGSHAAANTSDAGAITAAAADGGAKANPVGGSVEKSTEGATATATSGDKGGDGAMLDAKHQAANGPEGGIKGDDKSKTASDLVAELRKAAAEGETKTAADVGAKEVKSLLGHLFRKTASEVVADKLVSWLGKVAFENEGFRKMAAEAGMGPEQAQAAGGDQAVEQIIQAIESGQMSEEDAQKLLEEAAQAGVISPEEVQQAMAEMQAAGGDKGGAPEGAPEGAGAGAPPMGPGPEAAGAGAPPMGPEQAQKLAEAKLASADIGPEHPMFMSKLASLYGAEMEYGYQLAIKTAEHLTKQAEHKEPDGDEDSDDISPKNDEEKKVLDDVKGEMGLDDSSLGALMSADSELPKEAKLAAYELKVRRAILNKTAALATLERLKTASAK